MFGDVDYPLASCMMVKFTFLTHWSRMTHICVSKLTIIGSDYGLSPDRRQAIIWTNDGILLIGPLGTNFSEISIEILTFAFKKMRLKVSAAKRRPFCLGLNVLNDSWDERLVWWIWVLYWFVAFTHFLYITQVLPMFFSSQRSLLWNVFLY